MSQRIAKFCEDLRLKLTNMESGLGTLKTRMEGKQQQAEQEVRNHLESVKKRIAQDEVKASAARTEIEAWLENERSISASKIAEWKANHELSHLQNRADFAERYAKATIHVALSALDEAERASLEAWLARAEANPAQSK
jgi:membrane carboxypeptidase/penicillin-binding protein